MPIDESKLVLFPAAIQQPMIDPNTGIAAAGGWIEFTQTDQTTPKAVYKQTGDPGSPFEVANDLTPGNKGRLDLNNAGAPMDYPLFLYPVSEVDNKTAELYHIRVNRSDGSTILTSDDMPLKYLNDGGDTPASDEHVENLLPSYGFSAPAWASVYNGLNYLTRAYNYPAWGWVWHANAPSNIDLSYTFTNVQSAGLDGDPMHQINLIGENKTGNQTENWLAAPVGYRSDLVGQACEVWLYNQDNSTLAVTEMDVYAIFAQSTNATAYLPPVKVGEVTLAPARTKRNLQFTFPTVPSGDAEIWDRALIGFGLPLNQDFNVGLTGTFFYNGQDKTITVPLGNFGKRIAIARNANPKDFNNSTTDWQYTNLPKTDGIGQTVVQNRTGLITSAGLTSTARLNFAHLCDGTAFVKGEIIDNVTLSDRIFDAAHPAVILSPNSFVTSNITATGFEVELSQKGHVQDAWTTNITGLTIVKSAIPCDYGISGVVNGGNPNRVDITFTTNFDTNVTQYNFRTGKGDNWRLLKESTLPAAGAVVNWFGSIAQPVTSGDETNSFIPLATAKIDVVTTEFGSGVVPAEAHIIFGTGITADDMIPALTDYKDVQGDTLWANVPTNYLAYLSKHADPMPYPPPYVISFKVDKAGDQIPVGIHNIVVQLATADLSAPATIATKLANELSEGDKFTLTYTPPTLPATGEWIKASTAHHDVIFIYWESSEPQPTNPNPERNPIYIKYDTGITLAELIKSTANVFETTVGGFPTGAELNLAGYPELSKGFAYYMEI